MKTFNILTFRFFCFCHQSSPDWLCVFLLYDLYFGPTYFITTTPRFNDFSSNSKIPSFHLTQVIRSLLQTNFFLVKKLFLCTSLNSTKFSFFHLIEKWFKVWKIHFCLLNDSSIEISFSWLFWYLSTLFSAFDIHKTNVRVWGFRVSH